MKSTLLCLAVLTTAALALRAAEPNPPRDQASTSPSWRIELHADTMDRSIVPMIAESKTSPVNAETVRTETATRTLLGDGSYYESQRVTSQTTKTSPDVSHTTSQVVEIDRQGAARTTRTSSQTDTKTAAGELREIVTSRRNSSGEMVPDRAVTQTTAINPDGSRNTARLEKVADVNGNLVLERRVQETTREPSKDEKVTTSLISAMDHVQGRFALTAQEVTTVRAAGDTTRTERLINEPAGLGWTLKSKVVSTETRAPDGSIGRETIRYGRPSYAGAGAVGAGELAPQLKIEERLVSQPDGTAVLKREVYFRDVNGGWKPQAMSLPTGSLGDLGP